MTTLVSLDTDTGIIRRWEKSLALGTRPTHAAGLTHDPEDALKTSSLIESFRCNPHVDHAIKVPRPRTMEDALREQRMRLANPVPTTPLLLGHSDEA